MSVGHTDRIFCTVIPDGVYTVYFFHVQIGDLDGTHNLTKNE